MDLRGVSSAETEEFIRQLDVIVHERGGLWEPLGPSTVVLPGRTETHGPWPIETCAQVLLQWLDAGFLGIYRVESAGAEVVDLSVEEARAVLADPTAWRPDVGLYLFPTASGEAATITDWRAVSETSARRCPLSSAGSLFSRLCPRTDHPLRLASDAEDPALSGARAAVRVR